MPDGLKKYNFRDNVNPVFECVKRTAADAGVAYRDPFELGKFGYDPGTFSRGRINIVRAHHIIEARNALVASAQIRLGLNKAAYLQAFIGKPAWTDDVPTAVELFVLPEKNIWYEELERACGGEGRPPPPFSGFQSLRLRPEAPLCIEYGQGYTGSSQSPLFVQQFIAEVTVAHFTKDMELKKVTFGSGIPPGIGPLSLYNFAPDLKRGIFISYLISVVISPTTGASFELFFKPDGDALMGTTKYVYEAGVDMFTSQSFNQIVKAPMVKDRAFMVFRFRVGVVPYDLARVVNRTPADPYPFSITVGDDAIPNQQTKVELVFTGKPPTAVADLKANLLPAVGQGRFLSLLCKRDDPRLAQLSITKITGPPFILRCTPLFSSIFVYIKNIGSNSVQYSRIELSFTLVVNDVHVTPPTGTITQTGGLLGGTINPNSLAFVAVPIRYNPIISVDPATGEFKKLRFPPGTTALIVNAKVFVTGVNNTLVTTTSFGSIEPGIFQIRDDSACEELASLPLKLTFLLNGGISASLAKDSPMNFTLAIYNPNSIAVGGVLSFSNFTGSPQNYRPATGFTPPDTTISAPANSTTSLDGFTRSVISNPIDDRGSLQANFNYTLMGGISETTSGFVQWFVSTQGSGGGGGGGGGGSGQFKILSSSSSEGSIYLGVDPDKAHSTEISYEISNGTAFGIQLTAFSVELKNSAGQIVTGKFKKTDTEAVNEIFIPAGASYTLKFGIAVRDNDDTDGASTGIVGVIKIDGRANGTSDNGTPDTGPVVAPGSFTVVTTTPPSGFIDLAPGPEGMLLKLNSFDIFVELVKGRLLFSTVNRIAMSLDMVVILLVINRNPTPPQPRAGSSSDAGKNPLGMLFGNGEGFFIPPVTFQQFGTGFRPETLPVQYMPPAPGSVQRREPSVSPSGTVNAEWILALDATETLKLPFTATASAQMAFPEGLSPAVTVTSTPVTVESVLNVGWDLIILRQTNKATTTSSVEIKVPGVYTLTVYGNPYFFGGTGANCFWGYFFTVVVLLKGGGPLVAYNPHARSGRTLGPIEGLLEKDAAVSAPLLTFTFNLHDNIFKTVPVPVGQIEVRIGSAAMSGINPTGSCSIKIERTADHIDEPRLHYIYSGAFFREDTSWTDDPAVAPGDRQVVVNTGQSPPPPGTDPNDIYHFYTKRLNDFQFFSLFQGVRIYGTGFAGVFGKANLASSDTHLFLKYTTMNGETGFYGTKAVTLTKPNGQTVNVAVGAVRTIVSDTEIATTFNVTPQLAAKNAYGNAAVVDTASGYELRVEVNQTHPTATRYVLLIQVRA